MPRRYSRPLNTTKAGKIYADCSFEELIDEILDHNRLGTGDEDKCHTFYAAMEMLHRLV